MTSLLFNRRAARLLFHPSTPLFPSFRSFSHPFQDPYHYVFHVPRRRSARLSNQSRPPLTAKSDNNTPSNVSASPKHPSQTRLRSPYDLVHFRRSRFVAHLNELARRSNLPPNANPDPQSCLDRALTSAGLAHEDRVISHLISLVSSNLNLSPNEVLYTVPPGKSRLDLTNAAIQAQVPLIRSAVLRDDTFSGVADVLLLASADPFASPSQRARARQGAYVVCEIKLASKYTADYALQAAIYASMLAKHQREPRVPSADWAYLWVGSPEQPPKQVSLRSLMYLLDRTRQDFDHFLTNFREDELPQPDVRVADLSPWKEFAQQMLEEQDSLRLIAGIKRSQVAQIEEVLHLKTLEDFANLDSQTLERAIRTNSLSSVFRTLQKQACMQLQTRQDSNRQTAFEVINAISTPPLPPVSDADMFFDMEGFPLMEHGGLEYLHGLQIGGGQDFRYWWAHNRADEEESFVQLMQWISTNVKREKAAGRSEPHIFHYGHYEVAALRRVALRVTTGAGHAASTILDDLILNNMFVDIHKVVTSALVVGEPSYSIKKIEKLVGISRENDELADAESSVGMYYEWRSKYYHDSDTRGVTSEYPPHPILQEILSYNQQDCHSLREVVTWLRRTLSRGYDHSQIDTPEVSGALPQLETLPMDDGADVLEPGACGPSFEHKRADSAAIRRSTELSRALLEKENKALCMAARKVLANVLQYYVRESLPSRMQFSDRVKKASGPDYRNLYDDDQCLSAVSLMGRTVEGERKKKLFEYVFPKTQVSTMTSGSSAAFVVPQSGGDVSSEADTNNVACFVTINGLDHSSGTDFGSMTLSAGRNPDSGPPPFGVLVSSEDLKICDAPLRQSILRTTEKMLSNSSDLSIALPLAFLERNRINDEPFKDDVAEHFRDRKTRAQRLSNFLASRDRSCVFVIQGPPGSGKTSLSGEVIRDLVMKYGKTVAVSSNSHAAIDNLLSTAVRCGCDSKTVWKIGTKSTQPDVVCFKSALRDLKVSPYSIGNEQYQRNCEPAAPSVNQKSEGRKRKKASGALVGATCYQLCREDAEAKFDFLFIDEASQVPIPNFIAMSTSAKYAVLVGDQQQLEMPIKGAHPEIIEQSCLSFAVGEGQTTVPTSRGLFLERSYRMNPDICQFVSESFYDHALSPAPNCVNNRVHVDLSKNETARLLGKGQGIVFVPCDGFNDRSLETETKSFYGKWYRPTEVAMISKIANQLLDLSCTVNGTEKTISASDILVVAPYNAQVRALKEVLPEGMRVGTVDKFQGQEAPVALISTCTSHVSGESVDSNYEDEAEAEEWNDGTAISLTSSTQRSKHQRRGLRFALRKNRLNVAISRAQCIAIVTGDERAFSSFPMSTLEDVDLAALYEHVVRSSGA